MEIQHINIINYFHQQNNEERIKANEDQDFCFVVALKRAFLNGTLRAVLTFFLNFSYKEELTLSFFQLSIKVNRACVVSK